MVNKRIVSRSNWLLFSKKDLNRLFVYYLILFILSLIAIGSIFWFYMDITEKIQVSKLIVICSAPCSLFVIRRLYLLHTEDL